MGQRAAGPRLAAACLHLHRVTPLARAHRAAVKILVIRRDNIGDLVCATPLFHALRSRYPDAHIAALVNSYNAGVLTGNPALDAVHAYTKLKHRAPCESWLGILRAPYRLHATLRAQAFVDVNLVIA